MKCRLKVRMSKRVWKMGINIYDSIEDARMRQAELKLAGIDSVIVDEFGGNLM